MFGKQFCSLLDQSSQLVTACSGLFCLEKTRLGEISRYMKQLAPFNQSIGCLKELSYYNDYRKKKLPWEDASVEEKVRSVFLHFVALDSLVLFCLNVVRLSGKEGNGVKNAHFLLSWMKSLAQLALACHMMEKKPNKMEGKRGTYIALETVRLLSPLFRVGERFGHLLTLFKVGFFVWGDTEKKICSNDPFFPLKGF